VPCRNRARRGLDPDHPRGQALFDAHPGHLDAQLEPDAQAPGGLRVTVQDVQGADEAVDGAEGSAHDAVQPDRGIEPPRVLGRDLLNRDPETGLERPDRPELFHLRLFVGEEKIAMRAVPGIRADLVREAEELLPGEEREADVHFRRELGAEAAGRLARAAEPEGGVAVHDQHVPAPAGGEVPRDRGAHDPGAENDDLGGPHGICFASRMPVNWKRVSPGQKFR
jgi:hypothetical protein